MEYPVVEVTDELAARTCPGNREKVLWIHGYTNDSSTWNDLWAELPGWYHIGVDLPGHGGSRQLHPGEDLPSLARTLGYWAVQNGVRHLVGLSFGTIVSLQIAIEFPIAFTTIILGAPALAGGPQDPQVEKLYEELYRLYHQMGPGEHLATRWMAPSTPLFVGARKHPELWRKLSAQIYRHRWSELEMNAMHHLLRHPQRERDLRAIQARMLILVGELEMPAFRRCGEIIRRSVPVCERRYLPGVGHLCMLEAPAKAQTLIAEHLGSSLEQPAPRKS